MKSYNIYNTGKLRIKSRYGHTDSAVRFLECFASPNGGMHYLLQLDNGTSLKLVCSNGALVLPSNTSTNGLYGEYRAEIVGLQNGIIVKRCPYITIEFI